MNELAKKTIKERYGVTNVSRLEEFANICRPDKFSPIYHEFTEMISYKVGQLAKLLTDHDIAFSSNEFINGHLYRIYIHNRDLLLDFEYYPVVNFSYNYIRVNYNDDMGILFKKIFPEISYETEEVEVWQIDQKDNNKFLREQGYSPIYDKSATIIALGKDQTIYQSAVVRNINDKNKLVANVTRTNYQVNYGTIIILRYFKEVFGLTDIEIKSDLDNSFRETTYQLMNMKLVGQQYKKKIWWSPKECNWHIKKEHTDEYVPFYFTEKRTWIF